MNEGNNWHLPISNCTVVHWEERRLTWLKYVYVYMFVVRFITIYKEGANLLKEVSHLQIQLYNSI